MTEILLKVALHTISLNQTAPILTLLKYIISFKIVGLSPFYEHVFGMKSLKIPKGSPETAD
jgi:hypothetical protein